jgi:hypothetical protein
MFFLDIIDSVHNMRTFLVLIALMGVAAASYDEEMAIKSVFLAGAAYCPESQLIGWNCSVCASMLGSFSTAGVFYASSTDGQAYVCVCVYVWQTQLILHCDQICGVLP